ncbi:MAG: PLP-dependent aminotransferase family protein [Rhodospirillales bacterium]
MTDAAAVTAIRPAFAGWLGTTNEVTRGFLAAGGIPDLINLAGGLPPSEVFPAADLAELARQAILDHPRETLGYGPIEGLPDLRDALARRFSGPGLRLRRENVLVTTSGMQGLDLLGKILLEEGGVIAGQFPTYLGALDAWRPRCPRYRRLDLEAEDFDPLALLTGAQFAYSVPNFSNPTGRLIGLETRRALVAAAEASGTWLVEDDPYGNLYLEGAPLPKLIEISGSVQSGEGYGGPVIYLGTLSKQVVPGLRIGWMIAAPEIVEAATIAKQGSDMCTSGLTQRIALAALDSGLIDREQDAIRALYRERRDALCAALQVHLAARFDWEVPSGGMFVWAVARDPAFDSDRLMRIALDRGVCVSPSSVFDPEGENRRALRLNFSLNSPERLREGVRRLGLAVTALEA